MQVGRAPATARARAVPESGEVVAACTRAKCFFYCDIHRSTHDHGEASKQAFNAH